MKFLPQAPLRVRQQPDTLRRFLFIGPNTAFLLIVTGILLIYGEFIWVGKVVFALAGAICALIGMAAFGQMPHTNSGLLLLLLAAACFVLESGFRTFCLAGAAGSVFWALGFWKLAAVSPYVALPVSVIFGTVTIWLLSIAKRARRNKRSF